MNVGKLRKLIEGVADDVKILAPDSDHSYRDVNILLTTALYGGYGRGRLWTEDHGENHTPEAEYGGRVQVLVVR